MSVEVQTEPVEVTEINPEARGDQIRMLKVDIEEFNRQIATLNAEMAYCLRRLTEIPGSIANVQAWKDRGIQKLRILEGDETNGHLSNGYLEPSSVPDYASNHH